VDAHYFAAVTASQLPPMAQPRVAAGALFTDADGRVLLLRPSYKQHWDLPGGYVEPGESPLSACVREIQEELGITPSVSAQTFVVDWAPADGEGDKILFVFDGGILADDALAQVAFNDGEVNEIRFIAHADLDQYLPTRLARRINSALAARANGHAVYTEHGHVPSVQ
jgi:8-oxo-dGTP diphosphatase